MNPNQSDLAAHLQGQEPSDIFLSKLLSGRKILIVGHLNPDGDAVGSAAALALGLRHLGREVTVGLSGLVPSNLDFLMRPRDMFVRLAYGPELAGEFERMILVDCHSLHRAWSDTAAFVPHGPVLPFVAIDHHSLGQEPAFFEAAFLDYQAAATSELIFKVLKKINAPMSKDIADSLLAGLISDTGSFSQNNVTSECLRQASELVALGADIERINRALKQNWPLSRMKLLAKALATLKVHLGGRVATIMVTEPMFREAGSDLSETEGLVEYTLLLAKVELGALIKYNGPRQTRVSLRSRPGVDARALAIHFGGGGHQLAAAYLEEDCEPEQALEKFLARAPVHLTEAM
ncbi:MAG: bifunctional oligoribonuclease/PAP phosphatase NrnA [Deltaproteobacteria bacterium]|jgi:phosphoesterase RecJ-like protein|nr:bifunctional oligoribonuclease/PAP phosphatase NrnA [Deltaproteobacteria bacterium]